ncbi:MAG: mechanosensitive ion channel family protein [Anaerohalosphaeraceae bacterium]|nr:mechanosensitive ion channel family protein [Anaerohalosphaeraceae bacterium]
MGKYILSSIFKGNICPWQAYGHIIPVLLTIVILCVLAYFVNLLTRRLAKISLKYFAKYVKFRKTRWGELLLKQKVLGWLFHLALPLFLYILITQCLEDEELIRILSGTVLIYTLFVIVGLLNAALSAFEIFYKHSRISKRMPIRGFIQLAKIFLFCLIVFFVLTLIFDKKPAVFLSGFGAMVLALIFKDAILGFVAGVQISANGMISLGDWIEMPKYGADGTVVEVSLTTVKIKNWDKAIVTIPAYALVSDSFKNWRGMSESGARRIKRAFYIDQSSIKFCTEDVLKRFRTYKYISRYMEDKIKELSEYNALENCDKSTPINIRRLTNMGIFRVYIYEFLKNDRKLRKNMTLLVRYLEATPHGLPIQIYAFSKEVSLVRYEKVQSDIFDHILAVASDFDLKIFQNPAGADFTELRKL